MAAVFLIFAAVFAASGFLAGNACAQLHAVPITTPDTLYQMDRYRVVAPQGKDWFELKRDTYYVYFGKKIASRTHSFIATAISTTLNEKFSSLEAFHEFVANSLSLRGDDRHTVIEKRAQLDSGLGRFCVRHYTKAEDRNALFASGKSLSVVTHGVSCLHPDNPALSVDVSYSERGLPEEIGSAFREEGEGFLQSLRFSPR